MVKTVAQMRNLRRGHDAQGKLKKVNLDSSYEGYSNFMAPMRMKQIQTDVEYARKYLDGKGAENVFTKEVLKPATDTYLTPEWDEFVPFPTSKSQTLHFSQKRLAQTSPPTAWKLRFDGFGASDYRDGNGAEFSLLQQSIAGLPDDFPPFYQPQGASKFGGSFAETVCVCNVPGVKCRCKDAGHPDAEKDYTLVMPADAVPRVSAGCGVPAK